MRVLAARTFRTGRQTLLTDGACYWIMLNNRRHRHHMIEVPAERAPLWLAALTPSEEEAHG